MNVEAYNLDSLRKLVRDLQKENKELREILDQADIPYAKSDFLPARESAGRFIKFCLSTARARTLLMSICV